METIKAKAVAITLMLVCTASLANHDLVTNVYARVNALYGQGGSSSAQDFQAIKGGGFAIDGMSDGFISLCNFVSNRCTEIVAEWPSYETKDVARFTLQSAIGYTGFSNMTNLADKVLSLSEGNPLSVSSETLRMVRFPYGTPFNAENYLALNIDVPGVSNIVTRLKNVYISRSETNSLDVCDEILSGERKQWLLEMKAAGAL